MTDQDTHLISDPLQEQAIRLACGTESRIVGITGQAGTGKTTIMKRVYHAWSNAGYTVALAAPTGKAAKRIAEATGLPAMTIHRLLEFSNPGDPDPETGKSVRESHPTRGPKHPLEQSIVLVDEYSMVNHTLNRQLIDAMPAGSKLRVFGDVNQLPPIEEYSVSLGPTPEGSPFKQHLRRFPSVKLEHIYRQGEGSGIVKNAHRILHKMCPQPLDDFGVILGTHQQPKLIEIVEADPEKWRSLDNQIITPTHRGWIGTRKLNTLIQNIVQENNFSEARLMPRNTWDKDTLELLVGDKVLWTKNDYNLMIFNGETGIVEKIEEYGQVVINFGDRVISVPPLIEYTHPKSGNTIHYDPRVQIKLAYAITTHASQGSEYSTIIYMMDKYAMTLQDQNNFYTGVTRARKHATVIADQWSFQRAVRTLPVTV